MRRSAGGLPEAAGAAALVRVAWRTRRSAWRMVRDRAAGERFCSPGGPVLARFCGVHVRRCSTSC